MIIFPRLPIPVIPLKHLIALRRVVSSPSLLPLLAAHQGTTRSKHVHSNVFLQNLNVVFPANK